MHWRGHVGAALLAYAPFGTWLATAGREPLALVGAAAMVALATLPDCDQSVPLLAHRGVTHTVPFALVVGVVLGMGGVVAATPSLGTPAVVGRVGFAVGVLSVLVHVAVDALTPMGVRPLWPLSRRRISLAVAPSRSPLANNAFLIAGVLASAGGVVVASG